GPQRSLTGFPEVGTRAQKRERESGPSPWLYARRTSSIIAGSTYRAFSSGPASVTVAGRDARKVATSPLAAASSPQTKTLTGSPSRVGSALCRSSANGGRPLTTLAPGSRPCTLSPPEGEVPRARPLRSGLRALVQSHTIFPAREPASCSAPSTAAQGTA